MDLVSSLKEWRSSPRPSSEATRTISAWLHARVERSLSNGYRNDIRIPAARVSDTAQSVLMKLWARRMDIPPETTFEKGEGGVQSYLESMLANTFLNETRRKREQVEIGSETTDVAPAPATSSSDVKTSAHELRALVEALLPEALAARRPQDRARLESSAQDCLEMLEVGGGVPSLLRRRGVLTEATRKQEQKTLQNKVYQQQHRLRLALRTAAEARAARGTLSSHEQVLLDRLVPELEASCQAPGRPGVVGGGHR